MSDDSRTHEYQLKVTPGILGSDKIQGKGSDPVNPDYYKRDGYELMDILEAWGLHNNHYLACAAKYIFRSQFKMNAVEDIQKAAWYLDRYLENTGGKSANSNT